MIRALTRLRWYGWLALAAYAALTIWSFAVERTQAVVSQQLGQQYVESLAPRTVEIDTAGLPARVNPLPYTVATRGNPDDPRPPVLYLHGTPGGASNFHTLSAALSAGGRYSVFLDLPGFGSQAETSARFGGTGPIYDDYSERFYADLMLRLLDELNLDRVHVVAWSNGGAAALWMAHNQPSRVASITLLASVGLQSTEGSGSYWFEHAKYGFGYATLVWAADLLPTFGILGSHSERRAFLRNFWDTDQRPLAGVMASLQTPTLILHGRHDFLTADWGAERHHAHMPASSLVMNGSDHFMPVGSRDRVEQLAAAPIRSHLQRHDAPGVEPLRTRTEIGQRRTPGDFADFRLWLTAQHYVVGLILVALLALASRSLAVGIALVLIATQAMDVGVAVVALTLGAAPRANLRDLPMLFIRSTAAAGLLWLPIEIWETGSNGFSTPQALLACAAAVLGYAALRHAVGPILTHAWTRTRRQKLLGRLRRWQHHEFWPPHVFYLPLIPYLLYLALKHRGLLVFCCCNPGIERGGGLVGESKSAILKALGSDPRILDHQLLTGTPDEKLAQLDAMRLGNYPIILKPDAGQRGDGVSLARSSSDAVRILNALDGPVVAQRYSSMPHEVGVFWMRNPTGDGENGRIYAITRKNNPEVTGDGVRTIEQLILAAPRLRAQHALFKAQLGPRFTLVPKPGERVAVGEFGNHSRGSIFTDGSDLITPQLTAAINQISLGFEGASGGGLDFGRYDIRYESEEHLRAGERLAVIEVNGTTAEATNLYDPSGSALWAYRILFGQWREAFRLGAWRRDQGVKAPSVFTVLRWVLQS